MFSFIKIAFTKCQRPSLVARALLTYVNKCLIDRLTSQRQMVQRYDGGGSSSDGIHNDPYNLINIFLLTLPQFSRLALKSLCLIPFFHITAR